MTFPSIIAPEFEIEDYWLKDVLRELQLVFWQTGNGEAFNTVITSVMRARFPFDYVVTPETDSRSTAWAQHLEDRGYVELGSILDESDVDEVIEHLKGKTVRDPWDEQKAGFLPADAGASVNVARYSARDVCTAPHLLYLANDPRIISTVHKYLGAVPTIQFVTAWWSFANRTEAREAQLYHTDYHGCKFLKLFIYMTEVDMDSGPHVFVAGSARANAIKDAFAKLRKKDPGMFENVVHKWQEQNAQTTKNRKSDDVIESLFDAEDIIYICGKKGDGFLENTSGMHKGQLPTVKDRLVFQVVYTSFPNFKDPVERVDVRDFPEQVTTKFGNVYTDEQLKYMNRLVVRF